MTKYIKTLAVRFIAIGITTFIVNKVMDRIMPIEDILDIPDNLVQFKTKLDEQYNSKDFVEMRNDWLQAIAKGDYNYAILIEERMEAHLASVS